MGRIKLPTMIRMSKRIVLLVLGVMLLVSTTITIKGNGPNPGPYSNTENYATHFTGSSLDSRWTTYTSNGGTFSMSGSYVHLHTSKSSNSTAVLQSNRTYLYGDFWIAFKKTSNVHDLSGYYDVQGVSYAFWFYPTYWGGPGISGPVNSLVWEYEPSLTDNKMTTSVYQNDTGTNPIGVYIHTFDTAWHGTLGYHLLHIAWTPSYVQFDWDSAFLVRYNSAYWNQPLYFITQIQSYQNPQASDDLYIDGFQHVGLMHAGANYWLFDAFPGTSLNQTNWVYWGTGTPTVSNGWVTIPQNTAIQSTNYYYERSWAIQAKFSQGSAGNPDATLLLYYNDSVNINLIISYATSHCTYWEMKTWVTAPNGHSSGTNYFCTTDDLTLSHSYTIQWDTLGVRFAIDGGEWVRHCASDLLCVPLGFNLENTNYAYNYSGAQLQLASVGQYTENLYHDLPTNVLSNCNNIQGGC